MATTAKELKEESTVKHNVDALIGFNLSMATALAKAKRGSCVEDDYFVEKLEKTANRLNFTLVPKTNIYP